MNIKRRKTNVLKFLSFILCFILFACQMPSLTKFANTPTETRPLVEIKQWAKGALADSTLVDVLVGRPDTLSCNTFKKYQDAKSVDIYFDQPVIPSQVNLPMTAELSQDIVIQFLDDHGNASNTDYLVEKLVTDCPFLYALHFNNYHDPVIGIRITSTSGILENWDAIDAVEIVGFPAGDPVDLSTTLLATPVPSATPVPTPTFTAVPIGQRETLDRIDDYQDVYQLHVIYALFKDDKDLERDLDGSIARSIDLANDWVKEQTGGSQLRFDTYQGQLDVTFVQFDDTSKEALNNYRAQYELDHIKYNQVIEDYYMDYVIDEMWKRDFFQKGKYYIFYLEEKHPNSCGFSLYSSFPGIFFLGTTDCGYGRLGVDKYTWSAEFVLLHEILHGIGFTPLCSPHNVEDRPHHVNDSGIDLMYPYANAGQQVVLDVGNDDYFKHGIKGCPDLANSVFLEPLSNKPEVPKDWPADWKLP